MDKFLITGLGNPGSEYAFTRHNIGFLVADKLADSAGTIFVQDRHCWRAEYKIKGRSVILIKPSTYMNLSGKAVLYWLQKENISIENLLVITDDIALPFGTLRLKPKGSHGGHNGLRNISELLQSENFARLRFGVGSDFAKGRQSEYVLGNWAQEESDQLTGRLETCVKLIESFCMAGIQLTMTAFNNK